PPVRRGRKPARHGAHASGGGIQPDRVLRAGDAARRVSRGARAAGPAGNLVGSGPGPGDGGAVSGALDLASGPRDRRFAGWRLRAALPVILSRAKDPGGAGGRTTLSVEI